MLEDKPVCSSRFRLSCSEHNVGRYDFRVRAHDGGIVESSPTWHQRSFSQPFESRVHFIRVRHSDAIADWQSGNCRSCRSPTAILETPAHIPAKASRLASVLISSIQVATPTSMSAGSWPTEMRTEGDGVNSDFGAIAWTERGHLTVQGGFAAHRIPVDRDSEEVRSGKASNRGGYLGG